MPAAPMNQLPAFFFYPPILPYPRPLLVYDDDDDDDDDDYHHHPSLGQHPARPLEIP